MSKLFYNLQFAALQPVFDKLRKAALQGMGYGNAALYEADANGEGYFLKNYLSKKQLEANQGQSFIVFDVGAHNGKYCKLLADHLRSEKLQIFAFEPDPGLYSELIANTVKYPVSAVNKGLSDTTKMATLFTNFIGSGAYSLHYDSVDASSSVEVELTTLEDFCRNSQVKKIDFLKMDCEGHELSILRGAGTMLENRSIQAIQFEFSQFNVLSRTYLRDFWNLLHENYDLYRLTRRGLVKISNYSYDLEIFRGTNYIALLKN